MMVNENNKYTSHAEYYYNPYIDMYCIIGTTYSAIDFVDLSDLWESPELLTKVSIPDYVTDDDYDGPTW